MSPQEEKMLNDIVTIGLINRHTEPQARVVPRRMMPPPTVQIKEEGAFDRGALKDLDGGRPASEKALNNEESDSHIREMNNKYKNFKLEDDI